MFRSLAFFLSLALLTHAATYWPTHGWREATPESQGIDSTRLADVFDYVREKRPNLHSLLIVRHGHVVLDAYFYPYGPGVPHDAASVTKSVTSALIGIAIDKGAIKSVDKEVMPGITVKNLVTMTSGLECGFKPGEVELAAMKQTGDWAQFARELPKKVEPGTQFAYCSPGFHLLSATLSEAAGMNELAYAKRYLFQPLGIEEALWPTDPQRRNTGWGNLHLLPRDFAKIGYLYLHGGEWDGRQVISKKWIQESITQFVEARKDTGYGYGWWLYNQRTPPIFEANGRGGQRISVVPAMDLVVVMTGGGFEPGDLAPFLLGAMKSETPLPENPAALRTLREKTKSAAIRGPSPGAVPKLPELARSISGRPMLFDENAMDLKSLTLTFGAATGKVSLTVGRQVVGAPMGLDGSYRIAPEGPLNLPSAAMGTWTSDTEFLLDLNLIANINRYTMAFRFEGDSVQVKINEATGQVRNVVALGHRTKSP